jgi:hypothetical protein
MRSPAARVILGPVALLALGATAFYVNQLEQQITAARVAERAFDLSARELAGGFADLRIFQSAYLATGQDVEGWKNKVTETSADVTKAIADLQSEARGEATRAALAKSSAHVVEFGRVDQRAREYLQSGQTLMAGDVIFSEGDREATDAAQSLTVARTAERQVAESFEAGLRKRQAAVLAGAAGVVVAALLMLVLASPRHKTESEALSETRLLDIAHSAPGGAEKPRPAVDVVLGDARGASPYVTARPAGPVLRAASQLCTDLGRVSDVDELKSLIGQAADLMDASGIVIWIAAADGTCVQLALSHGYAPQVMARMSRIMRSADNAAAAAYRSGQMQIVVARPGESNGAIVAPLLSADGCIGALSAEIRGGGESSESVQALAAIFAAQLASVLSTTPAAEHQRTTATGTI